jgi:predicted Fe-Mo cluster-binding NifX family protein
MRERVMRVAIASAGPGWTSRMAAVFGRSRYFLLFDEEHEATEVVPNPGAETQSGSGVEAAQLLLDHDVDLVVTPKVGPKAHRVLSEAGMRFCFRGHMTCERALREAQDEARV